MPLGCLLIGYVLPLWVLFSFVYEVSFQPKKKKKKKGRNRSKTINFETKLYTVFLLWLIWPVTLVVGLYI